MQEPSSLTTALPPLIVNTPCGQVCAQCPQPTQAPESTATLADERGIRAWQLSLTHTDVTAMAVVLALG